MTNNLKIRIEAKELEKKALEFLRDTLKEYGNKQINKRFKDFLEARSPKYTYNCEIYNIDKGIYENEEKTAPIYSIYIKKDYFNGLQLYNNDFQKFNGLDNWLSLTIYKNHNATTEEEKEKSGELNAENLTRLVNALIEGINETLEKLNNDLKNFDKLANKYEKAKKELDIILESVHYYTRDQLTGKNEYNITKRD